MRQFSKVFSYSFKRTGLRVALPSLALFGAVSAASFAPDYTRYLDKRSTAVEPYAASGLDHAGSGSARACTSVRSSGSSRSETAASVRDRP